MCSRLALILILTLATFCVVFVFAKKARVRHGPGGMSINDTTTCVEFAKNARFNPYSVLFEKWFVFYYWGPTMPQETYIFTFPTANHTKYLHKILDGNTLLPVDWRARHILMEDHRNETSLLVERSDRGEYWRYLLYKVTRGDKIRPRDVRFKQTGDNRILGFMDCDHQTLLVMSRLNDVPLKKHLQDEAARLGFRGRRGKSYLYQGHEWMPIPEDDEEHYWQREKKDKTSKTSSNEVKSSEQSSEEAASQKSNTPEKAGEIEKNTQEKSGEKGSDTPEKKEENAPEDAEENENNEDNPHPLVSVDENELKANCIEILPEPWDGQENEDSTKKPENVVITKEYLDRESANFIEPIELADALDSSLSTNKTENKEEEDMNNKKENEHEKNESDTTNKEAQSTKEPPNQCQDCNEYVTSTDQPYVPENAHTSKYLENTRFTEEPVSKSLSTEPVSTQDPSESSPNTTNDPVSQYFME